MSDGRTQSKQGPTDFHFTSSRLHFGPERIVALLLYLLAPIILRLLVSIILYSLLSIILHLLVLMILHWTIHQCSDLNNRIHIYYISYITLSTSPCTVQGLRLPTPTSSYARLYCPLARFQPGCIRPAIQYWKTLNQPEVLNRCIFYSHTDTQYQSLHDPVTAAGAGKLSKSWSKTKIFVYSLVQLEPPEQSCYNLHPNASSNMVLPSTEPHGGNWQCSRCGWSFLPID